MVKIDGKAGLKTCATTEGVEYGMAVADYGSPQERAAVLPLVMGSFRYWAGEHDFPEDAKPEIVESDHVIEGRRHIGWYYLAVA